MRICLRIKWLVVRAESGMAMPIALFFVMIITALAAMFSDLAFSNLNLVKQSESIQDTFDMAEGAAHDLLRQMVIDSHLWREKVPLALTPLNYTEYSPSSYLSNNGIPSCSGLSCERHLYPTGGGLIKNYGPIGGDGDVVDTALTITSQLKTSALQQADVTLNGRAVWVQVERLDETLPDASSLGGDLSNNPQAGGGANVVRFRVTGSALRKVKGENGFATVVLAVEVPNA